MRGQWRGTFQGTNGGDIIVEIDEFETHFEGCAYLYDADASLPATFAWVRTPDKARSSQFSVQLGTLDPSTELPVPFSAIAAKYPDVTFPETALVASSWDDHSLSLQWQSNIGTNGTATISKSRSAERSECPVLPIRNWDSFKKYVENLRPGQFIFRGQANQWRLRTAFHRSGRADLRRYLMQDIPALHRHLSAITSHVFQLQDPMQNGAFFNLVQHHGFPTPLLDWSYSPYVAAYFAFEARPSRKPRKRDKVRIYVFDKRAWCDRLPQIQSTTTRRPHFSILETLGIENRRMIPQQALSSFTNVDDIESHIRFNENDGVQYLTAIDLPLHERPTALRELQLMGMTPGTLFPGLDGACREFRDRLFPI